MSEPTNTQQPQNKQNDTQQNHTEEGGFARREPMSAHKAILFLVIALVVAIILGVVGIVPRLRAEKQLQQSTDATAAPSVLVDKPEQGTPEDTVVLPGALQAYIDSPIYARTSGYLAHWYADIGAHVQKGQLLAVIDSPEVDQELAQAKAELATAQATAKNAAIQGERYKNLLAQNAVSQLDTDNEVTQQITGSTQVQSAQANVNHYEQLVGFERIYAPFTGVITARDIDNGQLINAGASTSQMLFEEAQINTLRVYVSVPQIDSLGAKPGVHAQITLGEYPNRTFDGVIVRTADSIDPTTRTLLVEVDVKNNDGALLPGAYGEVHLKLNTGVHNLLLSTAALIFNAQGLQVGVVRDGKAYLVPVTIGQNDGRVAEIVSGLNAEDDVIQNPPDSLTNEEPVSVVTLKKTRANQTSPLGGPKAKPAQGNDTQQQTGSQSSARNANNASQSQQEGSK